MKDLTQFLVKNLADHPEQVSVQETEQGGAVTLKLSVAEEDKGKIIGKKGKVIKAIRALVAAAGTKAQKATAVDID
ncbi:MAG: KH domain-containing protein [Elusimicrobia bacterium]|nr:KH domain-containing protein [Elusimicrobiota bacterium]